MVLTQNIGIATGIKFDFYCCCENSKTISSRHYQLIFADLSQNIWYLPPLPQWKKTV